MAQLRQDFAKFEKRHTQVVVVGPENAQAFRPIGTNTICRSPACRPAGERAEALWPGSQPVQTGTHAGPGHH